MFVGGVARGSQLNGRCAWRRERGVAARRFAGNAGWAFWLVPVRVSSSLALRALWRISISLY
jgi:hypothetical protein